MGLWQRLTSELIDVIDWLDDSNDTMVYRYEREDNAIKYGAMLTVRESQVAVFVNEGQIADVFPPGLYQLETNNLPVLTTLQSWPAGFDSPFKAEVYFVSTKQFTDQKWGTKNPVMLRDPEFSAVRLRAFGTYSMRISDPVRFLQEIAGTDGYFTTEEITDQLRNMIVSRFSSALGESNIPILDLAANYDDLGEYITAVISPEFKEYGLGLTKLLVENISLPEEVEKALDKKTSMGIVGDLSKYVQYESGQATAIAAGNPGGAGASGIGLGLGIAVANRLGQTLTMEPAASYPRGYRTVIPSAARQEPPPLPSATEFYLAQDGQRHGPFTLEQLKERANDGSLTLSTLIWTPGMANWAAASQVGALSVLLAEIPPPLPENA